MAEQFAVLYRQRKIVSMTERRWTDYAWHDVCSAVFPCEADAYAHAETAHVGEGLGKLLFPAVFKLEMVEEWG